MMEGGTTNKNGNTSTGLPSPVSAGAGRNCTDQDQPHLHQQQQQQHRDRDRAPTATATATTSNGEETAGAAHTTSTNTITSSRTATASSPAPSVTPTSRPGSGPRIVNLDSSGKSGTSSTSSDPQQSYSSSTTSGSVIVSVNQQGTTATPTPPPYPNAYPSYPPPPPVNQGHAYPQPPYQYQYQNSTDQDEDQDQLDQDEEEDDMEAERDLADDAPWKKIQQNTFTRWMNEHLKTAGKSIESFETDLSDGLALVTLIEVLSGKQLPRHNKKPSFRSQKLENVSVALKFLEKDEGIRIVNIDATDIVDSKLKLILGLIWHLILHYSISMPMWEGEEEYAPPKGTSDSGPTPKQRLLHWVQNKVPEMPINNFTTDWNDGRAVGALVDAVAPGLCPDWQEWSPKNALQNAQEAMGLADDWLNVPQLIRPEEITNPKIDELSIMTYLSQYPNAKVKDGAPLRPKKGTPNQRKCKAFGPGLDKGIVNQSNKFTIDTRGAGTGGLGLAIEGPSEAKMSCKDNLNGSCTVEYVPSEVGDYDISIRFADKDIPGSPFRVPVVHSPTNVDKVRVFGPGLDPKNCRQGVPQTFRVDATQASRAPLGVSIIGLKESPQVRDNGDGTYDVTYLPTTEGVNLIINVTWDGKNIPNTPVHLKVKPGIEPGKVKVSGAGVSPKGVPASLPTEFLIDTTEAGFGDLEVQVLGPDGYPRKVKVTDHGDGIFKGTYVPDDCGRYKVNIKYGNQDVPHSPFGVQAFATGSADKCKITEGRKQNLQIGEEYCITVNTKNAGHGAVTCRIRSTNANSDLDIDIEDNGDGTFSIYYTVKDAGEYTINIKFGGQSVPEGFYTFTADSHQNYVKEERIERQEIRTVRTTRHTQHETSSLSNGVYRPVELQHIPLPSTGGHVVAEIRMPSGQIDKPIIEDNRDGTVSIKYAPREEGSHELGIKYNGEHVQGSPFKFHVDTISSGYVTAYGPGLVHGVSGEPAHFTISTKGAGADKGLGLSVEGPSKAEISCHDNKDGTVSVAYLPTAPGEYKISCKFGEKNIKGSPFTAKITGEGRKRNQISVGSCSEVTFPGKVTDQELKALNASICAPSGLEEPCFLKRLPNGSIGISFTPREEGQHEVSVKKMGSHIANSPFKIQVADREVGDSQKVKLSGAALKEGKTHVENTFNVDTRQAGYGGLSLSVEGPSKADISCQDKPDGTLDISYKPTEPGYYIINLKFADHHVSGSPFTAKITGEGTNRQRERIQRQREAVPVTEVGSECRLTFKMPGITQFDLSATVTSPGGVTEDAAINEVENGLYAVHFVPKELGVHTVSVRFNQIHIPGSPFQFTVGPLRDGGAHRVHAGGPGLERGEQGQPAEFNIWTREAGAGALAISVEGPSKAEIDFKDRKDGSCYVSYVVNEPGEYRVGIKFNENHVPDSPYVVYISPDMGEARKVDVGQFPEGSIQTNKPAMFMVRKNGAKGTLDAKLVSPAGVEDDCFIDTVDFDTYSVRFMPKENGINNVHIKLNQVHIPGSPYRIKVGKDEADPAAVHAHGKGLEEVKTGQKADFIIDTCNAGAGHLVVTIDGQSKVSMDCTEVEEGYKVRYTPLVAGDYYITIKYNGYHIVGSPFKVGCTGKEVGDKGGQETSSVVVETVQKMSKHAKAHGPVLPLFKSDASKITCKGMGLKKAYLQKQNQFTIQAGDAGNNILFVGLHGPKGPCDEVFIKHMGYNNYQVNYVCRERGDYIIIAKWGDEHIPGSPFRVEV